MSKRYTLNKAFLLIFLSTSLISGSAVFSLFFLQCRESFSFFKQEKPRFLAQEKAQDQLSFAQLSKILGLFADQTQFDREQAKQNMESFSLIKKAKLSFPVKNTLFVDYALRDVLVYCYDITGAAIDQEGFLFPSDAFIHPKKAPRVYFGLHKESSLFWGLRLSKERLSVLTKLLKDLSEEEFEILFIDLSKVSSKSLGKRQVVVLIEESTGMKLLRLSPQKICDGLRRYKHLKPKLQDRYIVDLRLDHLAFIQKWPPLFVLDN